jgi:hypothetical protein
MTTVLLLIASNLFMTIAWYGHLRFPDAPLGKVIMLSWGIALVEYCFAIPANRIGFASGYSVGQLKIMQEVITLAVFGAFAVLWLGEALTWRHAGAFACMVGAVAFMFWGKS